MKKLKKENKVKIERKNEIGITLIALVITIIVLLILAGVSIVMLTGDNGILKQATEAKVQTDIGEQTEKIKLAVTDAKITNEEYQELNFENLRNAIAKQFGNVAEVTANADGTFLVKIKDRTYNIFSDGTLYLKDPSNFASLITPQNYGEKVKYSANGVTDWKIFDNDGNNVFLIASDYLENTKIPSDLGIVGEGTYKVSWNELIYSGAEDVKQEIANKYKLKCYPDNKNSMKAVASLMDIEKWKVFVDTNVADSAIGSPTIEMFCDSWNQKGYTQLYCNNYDSRGYFVGGNDKPSTMKYDISSNAGYNDKLYYPHKELTEDGCMGYFLASTVANDSGNLMRISSAGNINYRHQSVALEGLRPVICLKTSINGEWDKNKNEWILK